MSTFQGHLAIGLTAALCSLTFLVSSCGQPTVQAALATPVRADEPEPVAVTVFTEEVELFMEYPELVPGLEARFLAHITVLATGEPVRSGKLHIELSDGLNEPVILRADQPARDGLFIPIGVFQNPATYQANIVVTSDQITTTIPLDPIVVHADLAGAFAAADKEPQLKPSDAVPFLLEQQWKIGLLMQQVSPRLMTQRLQVPGEIEVPSYGRAMVSAQFAGRLLPPPSARLPRIGERVEKGQVLALVEPTLSTSDRAQLLANDLAQEGLEMGLLIQEYELQAKALEVDLNRAQADARLKFAKSTLDRVAGLRAKGLGTTAELEAASLAVEIAEQASNGSKALRDSFAQSRELLASLGARRESAGSAELRKGIVLVAPISGEIIEANYVVGELVAPHEPVFQVLDLSKAWVTAHVSEFDLGQLHGTPSAVMELAAYPGETFKVTEDLQGRLVSSGPIVDPENRTVALRYELTNPDHQLRAGMFADVFLETRQTIDAVAIPAEAIVMDNGRPVAFVLVHGELFQKRVLALGIRDGAFVEVLSGLIHGERVVTKGAYLVKLASASPASFGEGHAH